MRGIGEDGWLVRRMDWRGGLVERGVRWVVR